MIPYETDPSLYTAEPEPPMLDDGFSPPHHVDPAVTTDATSAPRGAEPDPALSAKSPF